MDVFEKLPCELQNMIYVDYFSPEALLRSWFHQKETRELNFKDGRLGIAKDLLHQVTDIKAVGCDFLEKWYVDILINKKRNFRNFSKSGDVIVSTCFSLWH
jgi:hypothetical protein